MWINLLEISDEGKSFICNRQTSELNEVLKDLIGETPYTAEFTIKPMQAGTFELVGHIKTEAIELCSRCGIDIKLQVFEKFKEMMLPELDQPRNTKYAKANHFSEMVNDDLSVVEYKGHRFNAGEYLHEVVALALPFNPSGPVDDQGNCTICLKSVATMSLNYDEPLEMPVSPFASLKGIKLN